MPTQEAGISKTGGEDKLKQKQEECWRPQSVNDFQALMTHVCSQQQGLMFFAAQ